MWNSSDIKQLNKRDINASDAEKQIYRLRKGKRFVSLIAPADISNGILLPSQDIIEEWKSIYNKYAKDLRILNFIPASGAASRMFRRIQELLTDVESQQLNNLLLDEDFYSVGTTLRRIDDFAFSNSYAEALGIDKLSDWVNEFQYVELLQSITDKSSLGLAELPKGLITFHKYENELRTPFEEQICEATGYSKSINKEVHLHFTVSSEHMLDFENLLHDIKEKYYNKFGIKLIVDFSVQIPNTDTLAIDEKGNPFRQSDGSLLFWPAGHGALIENLNAVNSDIVFIKNIDNVVPERLLPETVKYKKALAGLLISLRKTIHEFLLKCEIEIPSFDEIDAMLVFAHNALNISDIDESISKEEQLKELINKLNRPLRVCGMVKNTGEPGGGPFWIINDKGDKSLQIVEKAQIDIANPEQKVLLEKASHFNPVDLVCSITNHHAEKFDLISFRDEESYLVADKTNNGRSLKALELPGLWNGAMAYWNTVFVEVPLVTFNPVKEINDLLRSEHQNEK